METKIKGSKVSTLKAIILYISILLILFFVKNYIYYPNIIQINNLPFSLNKNTFIINIARKDMISFKNHDSVIIKSLNKRFLGYAKIEEVIFEKNTLIVSHNIVYNYHIDALKPFYIEAKKRTIYDIIFEK